MDKFLEFLLRFLLFLTKLLVVIFVIAVLGTVFIFWKYKEDLPNKSQLKKLSFKQTSSIYDNTGEHVLYEVHGDENRIILDHDDIPDVVRRTIIAAEDDEFYSHHGIDVPGIFRAARENFQGQRISQGASTITQQLAKNIFLTRERTYERKFREIILALRMETTFEKDEILDMYLNGVSFGSNTYGIESAAQRFLGKPAKELTLDEAALLAALPKATSYYSPYGNHLDELIQRRNWILEKLEEKSLITFEKLEEAKAENTLGKIITPTDKIEAPHFVFYLLDKLEEEYGPEEIEEGGLEIISSLDYELQKKAEEIVKNYVNEELKSYGAENAAAIIMSSQTGEVLAMVGSRDFFDTDIDGEVNVATRPRQSGSSIKPVVYAAAFENSYQPETMLWDMKTSFGPGGSGGEYIPSNYDGQYSGVVSMRQALARSLNIPAVKTLYLGGINNFLEIAQKFGIDSLSEIRNSGLSLALGAGDIPLVELANAFGIIANEGVFHSSKAIKEIRNEYSFMSCEEDENEGRQVVKKETAWKISSILSDEEARSSVFGFSNDLKIKDKTVAVKTGTTQDYRDAWTIGYTPQITVGVWVGNNDYSPMRGGAAGIYAASPLWNKLMTVATENLPDEPFPEYEKVESDNFMITGKLETTIEYFNNKTGKKLSEKDLKKTKASKVRESIVPAKHSILYYIDRKDPLKIDLAEEITDPMFPFWEEAIQNPIWEEEKEE